MPAKTKDPDDIKQNQMVQTQEWHCTGCGRFLALQAIVMGTVKIKCPRCKGWNVLDISPEE